MLCDTAKLSDKDARLRNSKDTREMSQPKIKRRVGKYEVGRTIGEGTFAKVKFARNTETGEPVALKILDKEKVLKHKMAEQIKREIATMKLIKHPNVVRLYEVMGSKTKIFIVLEYVTGGELFDKIVNNGRMREDEARRYFHQLINAVDYCIAEASTIGILRGVYHRDLKPENLLLDAYGNLKVLIWLSALSKQDDGLLHTTCGTPNYVAPEVSLMMEAMMELLQTCGRYLPFDDSNLMNLYKKISAAEFTCPPWLSFSAMKLITQILDPNPMTSFSMLTSHIGQLLLYLGFFDFYLNNFNMSTMYRTEREQPTAMNAFELISMSKGFKPWEPGFKRETRFTSKCPANEIIHKIEEAAKPLGLMSTRKTTSLFILYCFYVDETPEFERQKKGNLNVATEIFQVAPSLHMVESAKSKGGTIGIQYGTHDSLITISLHSLNVSYCQSYVTAYNGSKKPFDLSGRCCLETEEDMKKCTIKQPWWFQLFSMLLVVGSMDNSHGMRWLYLPLKC
ncbi:hypothetical protein CXB51_012864 [Gossypium anomalum]|uniref:Protein kinase domain-containing protein n=1 Tax=Gossypium anomalum TaxID=47600 RepID=A0A8J5YXC4_9ROSI|nr:hypothetical protein CXB51_012864 [Gossypium anomalum]